MHARYIFAIAIAACGGASNPGPGSSTGLLTSVADVPLPGGSTRFDYQDLDPANGQLVVAHMNNNSVLILDLATGSVKKELPNIPTPRGVAFAPDIHTIFVTSTPAHLVLIDSVTLAEITRVGTGTGPDGDAWDPVDKIVGVSDQGDGALSLIANGGQGTRRQVPLGSETGNVIFDASRGQFWITVVKADPPDQLVEVDPKAGTVTTSIALPGCEGAHGLRLHPDNQSAFIACENNNTIARVDLGGAHAVATAASGSGPDVLSIDANLGWLYVAAESGDLTVIDINQPGVVVAGRDHPGAAAHTVAADPATHRVFFPLPSGPNGTPILRIMKPRD
jgi:DNA-binding beta-propeller fold protein YncE